MSKNKSGLVRLAQRRRAAKVKNKSGQARRRAAKVKNKSGLVRRGTREWAERTVNIQIGCENDCRYCYARELMVSRFHRCTAEGWREPVINHRLVDGKPAVPRGGGRVMFPSTHDITERNISECMVVLRKLLERGAKVLVVTKPHLACVKLICEVFGSYRDRILFRFTIGSVQTGVLRFWDRNAPGFAERRDSLIYAFDNGYSTSVSCEPYLDTQPWHVFDACRPYVTESIWFGLLRNWRQRVQLDRTSLGQIEMYADTLYAAQSDEFVLALYERLKDEPLVRWKDSIQEVLLRHGKESLAEAQRREGQE